MGEVDGVQGDGVGVVEVRSVVQVGALGPDEGEVGGQSGWVVGDDVGQERGGLVRFKAVAKTWVGEVVEGWIWVETGRVGDVVPVGEVLAGPGDVFIVAGSGEEDAGGGRGGGWGMES